jgi:hypothetical protein
MQIGSLKRIVVLLIFVLSALSRSQAQSGNQGSISGTVMDSSGATIPDATVTVTNEATRLPRVAQTNRSGFYDVESLEPGSYSVAITAKGFQGFLVNGLALDPGQRRQADASLKVGSASEQVTVEGTAVQVETQSSDSSGTITAKQVSNLMLNGRNFQALGQLVPGVSSTTSGTTMPGGGLGGETSLIINGNSVEYSAFSIDGIEDMNTGDLSNLNILPIVDAIEEFRILKDNYSARYGFVGSGQVIVQTKAGSSQYHGSAWDFLRSNGTDAKNYFSLTKTPFHQNIYGYTLGGPMPFAHHTFFFASNEWRSSSTGSTRTAAILTPQQRTGDFSSSITTPAGGLYFHDANSVALLASEGRTNCLLTPYTINPACIDPVAQYLMTTYLPQPTVTTPGVFDNYINDKPVRLNQLDYNYRVDFALTNNETLTARAMYEPVNQDYPYDNYAGLPYTTTTDAYNTTGSNLLLRLNSILSPRLNNIATAAYTDDKPRIIDTSNNVTLPSSVTIQQAFPGADTLNRIPTISIGQGYSGFGVGAQPIHASDGEGVLADDFSWIKSNHVLQFGAMYIFGIKRQNVFVLPQGSFGFSGQHTGDAAADFLLGLDSGYNQVSVARNGSFHYRQGEAYAQDDWKISPRLTLNLGLRYFYFSSDSASGDQVTNFDASTFDASTAPIVQTNGALVVNQNNVPIDASGNAANVTDGLVFAGQNGTPSGFFNGNKKNFAPRVGFAYALNGASTASIRGGYGIGYTRLAMSQIYELFGSNPPFVKSANVSNSLLSDGTAGTFGAPTVQSLQAIKQNQPDAMTQSYSLTFERQLLPNGIVSLAYAGSSSRHTETTYLDQNWPVPVSAPSVAGCLPATQTASSSYDYDPCINPGTVSANYTRPYPGYATIASQAFPGTSNYNSLQSGFVYRTNALQVNLAYTFSKVLSTFGSRKVGGSSSLENSEVQNWYDLKAEYGPPAFDRRHVFVSSVVYDLPFFRKSNLLLRETLGGWSFSGLGIMESGFAISPSNSAPGAGLSSRPDLVSPVRKVGTKSEWFSKDSFEAPAYGFYGSAGNGIIRGPSEFTGNAALYKNFRFYDKATLQFRAEAFNIANHPNWNAVSIAYGSGNFGNVTSALDPRILEFALRASF